VLEVIENTPKNIVGGTRQKCTAGNIAAEIFRECFE
jgi:hypothetical protein